MIQITSDRIYPEIITRSISDKESGAIVTFVGSVRSVSNSGERITYLEIRRSGTDTEERLRKVTSDIFQRWPIRDIAIARRIGTLAVGEIALVVAVSAIHRQEAFQACEYAVDMIKKGGITIERDIVERRQ